MKFNNKTMKFKEINKGFDVYEYSEDFSKFPMDGAIIEMNSIFGPKKNKFVELFFVLDGTLDIEMNDKNYTLEKDDMFIILEDVAHTVTGKNARVLIVCNPPFKPSNIEMLNN